MTIVREHGDTVRVAVVEDSFLLRDVLTRLLESDPRVTVVGVAVDYQDAMRIVADLHPDAIVTDVRMPPAYTDEGITLATKLREMTPETGVVVVSQYADPYYALGLVESGARGRGYLLKDRIADEDQLVDAILTVAAGGSVLDPMIVDLMLAARTQRPSDLESLTGRELEVLAAVASGASNRVIAEQLVLSPRSVEKHINAIFAKLGLTSDMGVDRRVNATIIFLADTSR